MSKRIAAAFGCMCLIMGYLAGRGVTANNIFKEFSCSDIAGFHADYMIRKYDIHDGFNTDPSNPKAKFNQEAIKLNLELLGLCLTIPLQQPLQQP